MARSIGFRVYLCAAIVAASVINGRIALAEPLRLDSDAYPGRSANAENDKDLGPNYEALRQVLSAMGREVSFEFFPPIRGWRMIARGELDGHASTLRTSARERVCAFPDEPLHEERSVLFVRSADVGKLGFSSFEDLVGHDVAVGGSFLPGPSEHPLLSPALAEFLRERQNMVETSGTTESLLMLASGRVDYAVAGLASTKVIIPRMGLSGKIEPLLSHDLTEQGVYVCFSKARVSPAFVEAFSRALRQFKQTEAYQALYRKYLP